MLTYHKGQILANFKFLISDPGLTMVLSIVCPWIFCSVPFVEK